MPYHYEDVKDKLFTDEGQRIFLKTRDKAHKLLQESGAFDIAHILGSDNSWLCMACIDRLVELGEIVEVPQSGVVAQHRIFVQAT